MYSKTWFSQFQKRTNSDFENKISKYKFDSGDVVDYSNMKIKFMKSHYIKELYHHLIVKNYDCFWRRNRRRNFALKYMFGPTCKSSKLW